MLRYLSSSICCGKLWSQRAYSGTHVAVGVVLSNNVRSVWCVNVVSKPNTTSTAATAADGGGPNCKPPRAWIARLLANQVDDVRRLSSFNDSCAGLTSAKTAS